MYKYKAFAMILSFRRQQFLHSLSHSYFFGCHFYLLDHFSCIIKHMYFQWEKNNKCVQLTVQWSSIWPEHNKMIFQLVLDFICLFVLFFMSPQSDTACGIYQRSMHVSLFNRAEWVRILLAESYCCNSTSRGSVSRSILLSNG